MLQKINIQAGINKQVTATGGEGQWVDGDSFSESITNNATRNRLKFNSNLFIRKII